MAIKIFVVYTIEKLIFIKIIVDIILFQALTNKILDLSLFWLFGYQAYIFFSKKKQIKSTK